MVLRPLDVPATRSAEPMPAWAAVAERQKRGAKAYWLISQPDHAALSGDLASNFISPLFPRIEPRMARAIGLHDAGWAMFASEAAASEPPLLNAEGKPLAFIEFSADQFLRAWTGSIESAAAVCAAGGVIVSRHFCELGDFRLNNGIGPEEGELIRQFIARERTRQERLLPASGYSVEELDRLLEVLKFCDLLSLYLCSGAEAEVEFPQKLTHCPVRLSPPREQDFCRLEPSPFQAEGGSSRTVSLGVRARYYPVNGEPKLTTLAFLIA